jgi:hypothetical protein
MAAGPVSRILSALRRDGHSSGPRITAGLKRPTRRLWRTEPARDPPKRIFLPIWSCSVWGLPCPLHYCGGGALLPHLFTLTWALRLGRYVFCGTFRPTGLNRPSRTLSGTLLCGVRTFLPSCDERPSGPAANQFIIVQAIRTNAAVKGRSFTACMHSLVFRQAALAIPRVFGGDGTRAYSLLGARTNAYTSSAVPINSGISPDK